MSEAGRKYYATVVDVRDPKESGLVKIRIQGLEDEIADSGLKWVAVLRPTTNPSLNPNGKAPVGGPSTGLLKGSKVMVEMVDGSDGQIPMIVGSMPDTHREDPSNTKGGTINYAEHTKKHQDYTENRYIAGDDRTDPEQSRIDKKPIYDYADNEATGHFGDTTLAQLEDWDDNHRGYSIGQAPAA